MQNGEGDYSKQNKVWQNNTEKGVITDGRKKSGYRSLKPEP